VFFASQTWPLLPLPMRRISSWSGTIGGGPAAGAAEGGWVGSGGVVMRVVLSNVHNRLLDGWQ
jgi:hypothetical protein